MNGKSAMQEDLSLPNADHVTRVQHIKESAGSLELKRYYEEQIIAHEARHHIPEYFEFFSIFRD